MSPCCRCCFSCCKKCCRRKQTTNAKDATLPPVKKEKSVLPEPEDIYSMSLEQIEDCVKDTENVYALAISVMQNYVGRPTYPYFTLPKQLYPYILQLCRHFDESVIKQSYRNKIIENMELTIIIKEAKIVHPKYTDFSNVYCKIWTESGIVKLTSVRRSSSMLIWDEGFILKLTNYSSEVLHIEVWSSYPGRKSKDPLSVETKEKHESDAYFVGDIIEIIRNLPCLGLDLLWPVKKGPRRAQTRGQLKLFIQLCAKSDKDHIFYVYMVMEIMTMAYENNLEFLEKTTLWKNWLEILPNSALTLIHQLSVQHGIKTTERCVCSWVVAATLKMKGENRMSFYLLNTLLEDLASDIVKDPVADYLEEALFRSISQFSVYVLKFLENLHENFDLKNAEMADELFYLLRCMNSAELKTCANFIDSYPVIIKEAYSWYLNIINDHRFDLEEQDQNIVRVTEGLKEIAHAYLKNQIILDDIFTRAWSISYCKVTFNVLDRVVDNIIKPIIKHVVYIIQSFRKERTVIESLKVLQLYHSIRNLVNYVTNDIPSSSGELSMKRYSNWFGEDLILEWFLLCHIYTQPFIERAVALDNMERINDNIFHGTSISDVAFVIDEIVIDVWMKLKWDDQFYTHSALVEAIRICVVNYVNSISKKIDEKHFFCDIKQFTVKEQLCVALSNVFSMFDHLNITKEKITSTLSSTEAEYGFTIIDPIANIESQLQIVTAQIFHKTLKRVSQRFRYFLRRMLRSSTAKFQSTALADTCTFIESTLEMLYLNLKPEIFYILLRHMWIIVVVNFNEELKCFCGSFFWWKTKAVSIITLQALGQLQAIFYCDGHGLSYVEMRNKIYMEMKMKIEKSLKTTHSA